VVLNAFRPVRTYMPPHQLVHAVRYDKVLRVEDREKDFPFVLRPILPFVDQELVPRNFVLVLPHEALNIFCRDCLLTKEGEELSLQLLVMIQIRAGVLIGVQPEPDQQPSHESVDRLDLDSAVVEVGLGLRQRNGP
jgi:hypothetical protein